MMRLCKSLRRDLLEVGTLGSKQQVLDMGTVPCLATET